MKRYLITSFYKFIELSPAFLEETKTFLIESFSSSLRGLFLLSPEGINATISGKPQDISNFKEKILKHFSLNEIIFKDSASNTTPFRRFKADLRDEIITYDGSRNPHPSQRSFLSPKEWHELVNSEKVNCVLIDTRNKYETKLGKFKGAIDPNLNTFTEFRKYIHKQSFNKDKKILLYCTGGVRCEKAVADMEQAGFNNVYQLHGGILKYLEEFPNQLFEGECFVFDHRVSVNQRLEPSGTHFLCPHCGDPGKESIVCGNCNKESVICQNCHELGRVACSKNCNYHLNLKRSANRCIA